MINVTEKQEKNNKIIQDQIICNAELTEKNTQLSEEIIELKNQLNQALTQIDWFKEHFKLTQQREFGKSSETSESLQLPLFDGPLQPDEAAKETITYERKKKSGRKLDTSKFSRERRVYDLAEADKTCSCGCLLEKIGEDTSEQVDYIPATLVIIEHVQPTYVCPHCETIKSAPKPESPIPKCMATAHFITDVIIKKYEHHLPLYRQAKILFQDGIDIPDNTLGNWVMGAAAVLSPLGEALWQQIPRVHVLQADETRVKILDPNRQGYMWGYHSCDPPNRFICFEFNLRRSAEVVNRRLKDYSGLLQTDGYSGYEEQRNKPTIIPLGCWDHARRKFTDVIKIVSNNKMGQSQVIVSLIGKLYQLEEEIKSRSFEERKRERQEKAKPILDEIYKRATALCAPPKSTLGKAITYLTNQWPYLIRYIDHGEAQISNCWIENQIRPFALGRKNWLFVGNEVSANKAALLYSLIQTCKLNHLQPRDYLIYVLNQAHRMRRNEVDPVTLLPQFIDKTLLQKN